MGLQWGSKRPLDTPGGTHQPSAVRALSWAAFLALVPVPAPAQAPPSASVWRVAAASLTTPAALAGGATGPFWNPAASDWDDLAAGIQVVQTSNVLGLTGILAGVTKSLGPRAQVGAVVARMDVRDLVRTGSSPTATLGSIPVYDQMFGAHLRARLPRLDVGALIRFHDARFDFIREGGVTVDLGARANPHPRVLVAVATHFLPVNLSERENTDYFAAVEYLITPSVSVAGLRTRFTGRYGLSWRPSGDLEHGVGAGAVFEDAVRVDAVLVRETAFDDAAWRPGFGLEIAVGRYAITFARSQGINDVGGTFRLGIDVVFIR